MPNTITSNILIFKHNSAINIGRVML